MLTNPIQVNLLSFNTAEVNVASGPKGSGGGSLPVSNDFLLMDGTNFLLMDGTNFLLMGT